MSHFVRSVEISTLALDDAKPEPVRFALVTSRELARLFGRTPRQARRYAAALGLGRLGRTWVVLAPLTFAELAAAHARQRASGRSPVENSTPRGRGVRALRGNRPLGSPRIEKREGQVAQVLDSIEKSPTGNSALPEGHGGAAGGQ